MTPPSSLTGTSWMICLVVSYLLLPATTTTTIVSSQPANVIRGETPSTRLLVACSFPTDPVNEANQHLNDGAEINYRDPRSGHTPLYAAVLTGKPKVVKLLLQRGANYNIRTFGGFSPAHGAANWGRADIMRLLNDHGANVMTDFHPREGYAPLHYACWGDDSQDEELRLRYAETVQYLLDIGTDPTLLSTDGQTCAQITNNPHVERVLLDFQARRNEPPPDL